jgi:hypothetical protein
MFQRIYSGADDAQGTVLRASGRVCGQRGVPVQLLVERCCALKKGGLSAALSY